MKKVSLPWSFVMYAACAAFALSGCKKDRPAPAGFERPPAAVRADRAVSREAPIYIDEIGRCAPRELVKVQAQVSGPILNRHFEDGADVKIGDLLFTIDSRPFESDLARVNAAIEQNQALLTWAKLELSRIEAVLKTESKGAVKKQDFDSRQNDVAVANAHLASSEAEKTMAQLRVEYCSIRSPIDGRAGERLVDAGNVVKQEETTLVVIQRLDPIYVDFTITERDLPRVRRRAAGEVLAVETKIPGESGAPRTGELTYIDSTVRDGSGTVKLRATYKNADHGLWPGQFVNVRLILEMKKDAVLVPVMALQSNAAGFFVFAVNKEGSAELRPVKCGQRHGDWIVIDEGVETGETVVVDGQLGVVPGAKVKILDGADATVRKA